MRRLLPWVLAVPAASFAQTADLLPETVILAERRLAIEPSIAAWDAAEISEFSPRTIDELLATEPSFSLYRRQTAVFGNPASAGVSLRNTGATAVSRTLVLRDGIPQNDPFGGWVQWARFEPAVLESVRIVPAAEAGVWGNLSPAGVIQLSSREPLVDRHRLLLGGGSHGSFRLASSNDFVSDDGTAALQATVFGMHSDGFHAVDSTQRGPVDRRLELDLFGADLRLIWRPDEHLRVEPALSFYDESRGNGTALAGNSTEAFDLSLRVAGGDPGLRWEALAYYQRRRFESFFSSVDATRSSEKPALDQFDVPGSGIGGGFTATWSPWENLTLVAGCDLRHLTGETNEDAGFVAGSYIRRRHAGGEQTLGGVFGRGSLELSERTRIDASLRLDHWSLDGGRRIERSHADGSLLRADYFTDRDRFEPGFTLAGSREVSDGLELSAHAGSSFRLPTINELYRPFRVRNDITEANAGLDPERFFSVGAAAAWEANDCLSLNLDMFHHWIRDAIANVPVTDPAEAAAIAGFVPAGGTVSQRRNVDQARVFGLETRADWRPLDSLEFSFAWLWSETEFADSPAQPLLEGKPFPQAPEHRLIAGLRVEPRERLSLFGDLEYGSHQFDDALARRRLGSWWLVRLGAALEVSESVTLHARIDNLFDHEIPAGLASNGLRTLGAPRTFWLGAEVDW